MEMSTVDWLRLLTILVSLPAATYYPFMFIRVKGWRTNLGRSMLLKGLALALLFWGALLGLPADRMGLEEAHDILMLCIGFFIMFAVHYQVWVMRRIQHDGEMGIPNDD